jgi:uncharacterized protein (TIGR04255 family)
MRSDRAPVSEVCFAIQFARPLGVTVRRAFELYNILAGEYPNIQLKTQIPELGGAVGPMFGIGDDVEPRYWFLSEDEAGLVQLQNDMVALNWRRRPPAGGLPKFAYPGFEPMKASFEGLVRRVLDLFKIDMPPVRIYNLFYDDLWPAKNLERPAPFVETFAFWQKMGLRSAGPNVALVMPLEAEELEQNSRIDVNASVPLLNVEDKAVPVARLTMNGIGRPKNQKFDIAIFDLLHRIMSERLSNILTKEAREGWYNV